MKSGKFASEHIFRRRKFWPQFLWLLMMFAGVGAACIFSSVSLLVASILSAFLGLNESGRWAYKTNLFICTAAAVGGSIAGVFTWVETASVFILLFAVGAFMLYYRDNVTRIVPVMEALAEDMSKASSLSDCVNRALCGMADMADGCEPFIVLADGDELYIPCDGENGEKPLRRNGSSVWRVFTSGRPYLKAVVELSKDQPLWRDARSLISVQMSAGGEKIGVLQLECDIPHRFSEDDLMKLSLAGFVIAHSLCRFIPEYEEDCSCDID